ncbi:MAG: hypothetical protein ACRET3_15835, partial [Burkholderiales bacterium]
MARLRHGVSAAESASALRLFGRLPSLSLAEPPDTGLFGSLCGVDSTTLPRGVRLLATVTDDFLMLTQVNPVTEVPAGAPVCGDSIAASPHSQPALFHSAFPDLEAQLPDTIDFSVPLDTVSVYSYGAVTCVGDQYGTLI